MNISGKNLHDLIRTSGLVSSDVIVLTGKTYFSSCASRLATWIPYDSPTLTVVYCFRYPTQNLGVLATEENEYSTLHHDAAQNKF